jgi:putative tricarboxylic transport membrane protein
MPITISASRLTQGLLTAAVTASLLALSACGANTTQPGSSGNAGGGAGLRNVTIVAPAAPGSGYDQTARAMQQALQDNKLATRIEVKNTEGAGGTIALSQLTQKKGIDELMVGGLALVGATVTNKSPDKLSDVTPVSRMIGEYEVIVVPANSPHNDLKSFLTALKSDPGKLPIAIGNQGGVDHIWGAQLAKAADVQPTDVNFVTFSGGGEALVALLGGKVAAGISGYGEFADQIKAGKLNVLAVSSAKPLEVAPDAPTIVDAGYPDAEFVNWRGVFAAPGLTADQAKQLDDTFKSMNDSEQWKAAREKNGWTDQYLNSAEFKTELANQESEVQTTLQDLGLA